MLSLYRTAASATSRTVSSVCPASSAFSTCGEKSTRSSSLICTVWSSTDRGFSCSSAPTAIALIVDAYANRSPARCSTTWPVPVSMA